MRQSHINVVPRQPAAAVQRMVASAYALSTANRVLGSVVAPMRNAHARAKLEYPALPQLGAHEEVAMSTQTPSNALIEALREQRIDYELMPHRRTQSAAAEARALGVDPGHVAKTLVLGTGTGFVRAVLPASGRIDLRKVKGVLGSGDVQLASEHVLTGAYPQFELGAVPPVGGPGHDTVILDEGLCASEWVVFEAGTHEHSVRIKTADLVSVTRAQIADICEG